ncbi:MAG TPA: hypothetical protein DCZ95_01350 [Verrucomicrobia bacterium]|nr:MAG: hypothetical protein A2X46_08930 [Lentisphaerae bacterium GWF2_57_35]HBA82714.1 hypothetical protein [Verrucomicrobiota bacterium]
MNFFRQKSVGWSFLCLVLSVASAVAQSSSYPFCQFLDREDEPYGEGYLGYTLQADVEVPEEVDANRLGFLDFYAGGGFLYFETAVGDFDIRGALDGYVFVDGGGLRLPDQVGTAKLGLQYLWRDYNGLSLRVDAWPGIYSDWQDVDGGDLFMPFGFSAIWAINPQLAALAGFEIYPEFQREIDPRIGLRWAPIDALTIDLAYPESRITLYPNLEWEIYAGASMIKTLEWQLKRSDEREHLMLDENRVFAGIGKLLLNDLKLIVEAGQVFDHELDFENGAAIPIEDALFLRAGIAAVY